jgi:hypothetical protein
MVEAGLLNSFILEYSMISNLVGCPSNMIDPDLDVEIPSTNV